MSNVKTDPSKVISTFDMDQSAPLGRAPKHLLFTDVCMVGWGKCVPPPPTIQTSVKFRDFEELRLC